MLTNYAVSIPPGGRTDAFVQTVITWNYDEQVFRTRGCLLYTSFFTVQHDAGGKDINLQMSVHMLVITLSGYAEVITEELYTTTFARCV